jgi:hypothetical protein
MPADVPRILISAELRKNLVGLSRSGAPELFSFHSARNLMEFEVVLVAPSSIASGLPPPKPGSPPTGFQSAEFRDRAIRRAEDFRRYLQAGRKLVIFVSVPTSVMIRDAGKALTLPTTDCLPFCPKFIALDGTRLNKKIQNPSDPFSVFWSAHSESFTSYHGCLSETVGQVLLEAPGGQALGALVEAEGGHVLFLPEPLGAIDGLCEGLLHMFLSFSRESGEPPPAWSLDLVTHTERSLFAEIAAIERQRDTLEESLRSLQGKLAAESRLKLLLSANGTELEQAVLDAFVELGFTAKPGPQGRDDLELVFRGELGVAEVKGVEASAAEAHANQLEKWLSERRMDGQDVKKGILVVNAYRRQAPNSRPAAFPDNVIRFSTKRDHSLLSTTQLFNMVLLARADSGSRDTSAVAIWNAIGLVEGFVDANQNLSDRDNTPLSDKADLSVAGSGLASSTRARTSL